MNEQPTKPPQPLDYATPSRKGRSRWFWFPWILFGIVGIALLASIVLPPAPRSHDMAFRVRSASNLRQIGQAIEVYNSEFKGRYPDTFRDLFLAEDIGAECFVCPSSSDTRAQGPTTQAIAANLLAGGHCSYLYVGKGLTAQTTTPDMVIAFEPLTVNRRKGMNVLFGDGHVEFIYAPQAAVILNQMKQGQWPVRFPPAGSNTPTPARTP